MPIRKLQVCQTGLSHWLLQAVLLRRFQLLHQVALLTQNDLLEATLDLAQFHAALGEGEALEANVRALRARVMLGLAYRDLNDLLSKNRRLETHFQFVLKNKQRAMHALLDGLARNGAVRITGAEAGPPADTLRATFTQANRIISPP